MSGGIRVNGMSLGVIVGDRDFFPDRLVAEGRADLRVPFRQAEGDAGLDQVVRHRDPPAEGVPPIPHPVPTGLVGRGPDEHRDTEVSEPDRVDDALLVSEVRQADEDAVDAVPVRAKQVGALLASRHVWTAPSFVAPGSRMTGSMAATSRTRTRRHERLERGRCPCRVV
jgi:hypothetical protein